MAGDAIQKIIDSVNKGITTVSVKTSSSLEKSKIKTHIDSLNKEIEQYYLYVGDTAYRIWESGNADFSPLEESFTAINKRYADIAALNEQLESIDARDKEILGSGNIEIKPPVTISVCPSCGSQYDTPVNFCRKCGTKIG